jgi:hypothetical protein
VDAATEAFLQGRSARLEADRALELRRLAGTASTLANALSTLNAQFRSSKAQDPTRALHPSSAVTRDHRNELLPQADAVGRQSARIAGLVLTGGRRTAATSVTQSSDRLRVDLVSGASAGLGLGALILVLSGSAGPRLGKISDVAGSTGLPLLAKAGSSFSDISAVAGLLAHEALAYVAADEHDAEASGMADRLTNLSRRPAHRVGAVIVASTRTRTDHVLTCQGRLALQGIPVRGIVLTTGVRRGGGAVNAFQHLVTTVRAILGRASRRRDER